MYRENLHVPIYKPIVCFSSCGNDSIALIQFLKESGKKNVTVAYNDTGWAISWWRYRVQQTKLLCDKYGFKFVIIKSIGMEQLVRDKKGWPMPASHMQFCTDYLKTGPSRLWLRDNDPFKNAICAIGVRHDESLNRLNHPEFIKDSKYEGRIKWAPLVAVNVSDRNDLIIRSKMTILSHSSMECFPCVCSNKADIKILALYPDRINLIEKIENEMGFTKKNKPRVMFRPYSHMGAIGIREIVKWGLSGHGKYRANG